MLLAMSPVKPHRIRPTRGEVRDRILDAASKVFAAEGFAGATIDAIGQAAGFTKGAVYSNFESKDELFLALLDREFERRGEQIATTLESGGDVPAAAGALSRSVLDAIHDHADYYVLFVEYWLRAGRDPELREPPLTRRTTSSNRPPPCRPVGDWPISPSSSSPSTWGSRWRKSCAREPLTRTCSRI
jgi:AcrR family transcriptional regulator